MSFSFGLSALAALLLSVLAVISGGWAAFWLLVGAAGFAAEAVALRRRAKGDTLSETVWRLTGPLWARGLLAVFMLWLTAHFVFRI
jgi:hypothetical protein